jgi:hypothetical protein
MFKVFCKTGNSHFLPRASHFIIQDGHVHRRHIAYAAGKLPLNELVNKYAVARGSSPGLIMWDLWWTKWRWGRFSPSISVSPANLHSTNCSTIIIIYHLGFVQ